MNIFLKPMCTWSHNCVGFLRNDYILGSEEDGTFQADLGDSRSSIPRCSEELGGGKSTVGERNGTVM